MSESQQDEDEGWRRQVRATYSKLQITVERYVERDGKSPVAYEGPSAFVSSYLRRLAALVPGGCAVIELPFEAASAICELALAARGERQRRAGDTGNIRLITTLTLTLFPNGLLDDSFTVRASINHTAPRPWSAKLTTLLCRLRDEFGPRADAVADALDWMMMWIAPEPLGPLWSVGEVVRLAHVVTAFESDDPVYLRVGQPSPSGGPHSSLYRIHDKVLTCIDDNTRVMPRIRAVMPPSYADAESRPMSGDLHGIADELGYLGVMRWELPCGGAVITRRGAPYWPGYQQYVVRCNDTRGIYVQRDMAFVDRAPRR